MCVCVRVCMRVYMLLYVRTWVRAWGTYVLGGDCVCLPVSAHDIFPPVYEKIRLTVRVCWSMLVLLFLLLLLLLLLLRCPAYTGSATLGADKFIGKNHYIVHLIATSVYNISMKQCYNKC